MAEGTTYATPYDEPGHENDLKRSITGRLLFFYTLGDVLGSGIYVLIGAVAGAVGGAFWIAFGVGVTIAVITAMAYAELVTKYPQAAGAALYVNKAFGSKFLTFLITVCFLSSSFAAAGALSSGFASYFLEVWDFAPALVISLVFVLALTIINFIGITESVVINMLMTFAEVSGLVIVTIIAIWYVAEGNADFGTLTDFSNAEGHPILGIISGVALAFFAMTGFENTANVAEETIEPKRNFPTALIGGIATAGVIYVVVAISAALTVDTETLAGSDASLLEVIKADIIPVPVDIMIILFAVIAMIAITNTTLVAVVTQPRILYGMANEDVVPDVFSKIHASRRSPWVGLIFSAAVIATLLIIGSNIDLAAGETLIDRLATVTVVFLLFIYALVIVSCLKLRGHDEAEGTYRANTPLLLIGLLGNLVLLGYVVYDDPGSLYWCAGLVALGVLLFVVEYLFGTRTRPPGAERGDPAAARESEA